MPEVQSKNPENRFANMELEEIRKIAESESERVAHMGEWPEQMLDREEVLRSLAGRIPQEGQTDAPGFDAGVACVLDLIPREKQKLSASLHGNYTPEAVAKVRNELENLDPDSETAWWLAAGSLCNEGRTNETIFYNQLDKFSKLVANADQRLAAAKREYYKMYDLFDTNAYGVPFGVKDGCIQAAYVAGYPLGAMYVRDEDTYYIGTYKETLGLENFPWSDQKKKNGDPKSGPCFGSRQFVMCANREEFKKALDIAKKHLNYTGKENSSRENIDTITGEVSESLKKLNGKNESVEQIGEITKIELPNQPLSYLNDRKPEWIEVKKMEKGSYIIVNHSMRDVSDDVAGNFNGELQFSYDKSNPDIKRIDPPGSQWRDHTHHLKHKDVEIRLHQSYWIREGEENLSERDLSDKQEARGADSFAEIKAPSIESIKEALSVLEINLWEDES